MNDRQFTKNLIECLNEQNAGDKVKLALLFIVKALGQQECLNLLEKAKDDFEAGLLIEDGSRQRSLGGCFFMHVPSDVNAKTRKQARELYEAMNTA